MGTADDYAAWIVANKDKQGTPDFETVATAYRQAKEEDQPAPPERSAGQELGRQAGLALRYGVEGIAGLPGIVLNPLQQAAGLPTLSHGVSSMLTRMGVPQEETDNEKLAGAVSRGVAGGGGMASLAKAVPMTASSIFAQAPVAQMAQSGVGAGASELTRQAGGGELPQLLAGVAAPMAAGGAGTILGMAGRGANELRRPITATGAKQVAADVVGSTVSDKQAAIRNIDHYIAMQEANPGRVGVPGVKPTAGSVSADYGLIGGEQLASRGPFNPDYAARLAANNEARLQDLAKLRATPEKVAEYEARRDAVTGPLRENAFDAAKAPVDYAPVIVKVIQTAATAAGGRAESERALKWITERIGKYADEGRVDPRSAYGLYQDIGNLISGKVKDSSGSAMRLAGGLANDVKKTLGAEIEKSAPGFQKYLETYSRFSRPIDRLETISKTLGGGGLNKVTNATPLAGPSGGSFPLSQDKMRNIVGKIEEKSPVPLAPYQRDILGRVSGDLNAEVLALRGGKMPGSDTYQNMATANLMQSILGKELSNAGLPKLVSAPLNFAYRPLEQRIQDMVNEAYMDPAKMAELLKLSRTKRGNLGLLDNANRNIYGGLLGANVGMQ